jgi:hypothetical protein
LVATAHQSTIKKRSRLSSLFKYQYFQRITFSIFLA